MTWLISLTALQALYSFATKSTAEALLYSGIFAVSALGCWQLGGWTSGQNALAWLVSQRSAAVPVLAGPTIHFVAVIFTNKYSLPFALLESVWIYCFFHASLAVWNALVALIKDR